MVPKWLSFRSHFPFTAYSYSFYLCAFRSRPNLIDCRRPLLSATFTTAWGHFPRYIRHASCYLHHTMCLPFFRIFRRRSSPHTGSIAIANASPLPFEQYMLDRQVALDRQFENVIARCSSLHIDHFGARLALEDGEMPDPPSPNTLSTPHFDPMQTIGKYI